MKKYLYLNFLLLLVTLSLYGQGNVSLERKINTSSFTLEDCIQYAENHNFTLQNVELNVQSSEINLRQAKENIAPSVSASASQGFNANNYQKSVGWNGNYGISAGMTLFKGLNNYNFIKQSKLQVEQSNLELEESKNRIRISIIQAFLSIMANEDLLTYQQDVIKSSQERMEQGEQQFRVGQILESDYKMLQAQYTSDLYVALEKVDTKG